MTWLDNAATSFPKAPGVSRAVAAALDSPIGNPGRPSSLPSLESHRIAFSAREETAALLGAPDSGRLIFTKNATEALNIALMGAVPPGGLLAFSSLEHNSVLRPARFLADERGVRLMEIPFDAMGRPDPRALDDALAAAPDLLVLTAASNVTGAVTPFDDIASRCRAAGIRIVIDGSQAVGHIPVSLADTRPSAFCFPGHKGLLGPEGTGGLWLDGGFDPEPLLRGGTGSDSGSDMQPRALPDRYEAGTQNTPALAGLLQAVQFLSRAGVAAVERREGVLRSRLAEGLAGIRGVRLFGPGPGERSAPVLSLAAEGWDPGGLAVELGRRGIAARHGLHCAPSAHRVLGTLGSGGTLRLSPGYFTTDAEIAMTVAAMKEILG
jgi:cysteine desulfurase / selenocysteine lyase